MNLEDVAIGDVLDAGMSLRGMLDLERRTGIPSVRLALRLEALLDDPDAYALYPRQVRVLRDRREARRSARRAHIGVTAV